MPTHRIHLKGPWQYEWLGAGDAHLPFPRSGRVTMPADWQSLFGERSGTARFTRRFHRPTNLEPHERVLLAFDGVGGAARIALNGRSLGVIDAPARSARFVVTEFLSLNNELAVELRFDPDRCGQPGGLWGPVAIEIASD